MATLTVYDAEGNEYTPDGEATGRNERIKELNLASVRFAIKPQERRVIGYFRAKATQTARAEQYYAEFTARNASDPIGAFTDALRTRLDEWGYILDESGDEMAVFQQLESPDRVSTPGAKNDRTILRDLATNRQLTNVGVGSPNAAVGLLLELADNHSVAITSAEAASLSGFDVAITVGRYAGIKPLGGTDTRWEQAKQSLRDQLVGEEIDTIKQSVQTLKRDHGLSADEIQRKVPGLSSTGSTGPSPRGRPASKGERIKQTLLSPKVGKYMFIGAVVLLVLLGGFYGATTLGFVDMGGGDTISGTVYDSSNEPVEDVAVTLTGGELNGSRQEGTDEDGVYEFADIPDDGTYTVTADVDGAGYTEENVEPGSTVDLPSDTEESGDLFSFLPFIGDADGETDDNTDSTDDNGGDTTPGNDNGAEEGSDTETDSQAPAEENTTAEDDSSTGKTGSESTAQKFQLSGTVENQYGQSEEGINVLIENDSLLADKSDGRIVATSGDRGEYETEPVLPNGTYSIETSVPVSKSNFDQSYSGTVKIAGNTTKVIPLE